MKPLVETRWNEEGVLYFGAWVTEGEKHGACRASDLQCSACEFSFRGASVRWLGPVAADQGYAAVFLDGAFQQRVDGFAESRKTGVIRFERTGLGSDRIHTLRVVVEKARHPAATDCFQRIEGFQSEMPVDYVKALSLAKAAEYAEIRKGTRPFLAPAEWHSIEPAARAPASGVILGPGLLRDLFDRNIEYMKECFALPHYCRESDFWNPEGGPGWSAWLPASNEGRLLAGSAHSLRWGERNDLRAIVDRIVGDISLRTRVDGYFGYYEEADSFVLQDNLYSERKNYDRVFWTRGLLAAGMVGDSGALGLVRRMYDWYDASPYPPEMLEGSNATNGLPGGPMMHLSPVGTDEDLIVALRYGDQEYWMAELSRREPLCLAFYPGERPHCYGLLALEAFLDEYQATGASKYLDAAQGGWDIYREHYKHIGGATAICEAEGPYPPDSCYITTGHNGETCGSVFWTMLNGKLMTFFPTREAYAREIEESLCNVLASAQDGQGHILYHNRLQGTKEPTRCENSCCEVSSAGLIGRLPEYIYSLDADGVFVNLFAASTIQWEREGQPITLSMETRFPFASEVALRIGLQAECRFRLRIRVPSWSNRAMSVRIDGVESGQGEPGSYLILDRTWHDGSAIAFLLPLGLFMEKYCGLDQIQGNLDRYALRYGPLLMALVPGPDASDEVPRIVLTPEDLLGNLKLIEGGQLEFGIDPYPGFRYKPYWRVEGETFSCFPVVDPAA